MDKKSIMAMVLIAIIIILIPYYQKLLYDEEKIYQPAELDTVISEQTDTYDIQEKGDETLSTEEKESLRDIEDKREKQKKSAKDSTDHYIKGADKERIIHIRNNKVDLTLSNKGGGGIKAFILRNYNKYDSSYVNLVDEQLGNGLFLRFQDVDGRFIETGKYLFKQNRSSENIRLKRNEQFRITYSLEIKGNTLYKQFIFYGDSYHYDVIIRFENPDKLLLTGQYQFGWQNGLPPTESYVVDDYRYNQAYVYMGEELENYEVDDPGDKEPETLTGTASWMAVRTKYFISSVINYKNLNTVESVVLEGKGIEEQDYVKKLYNVGFNLRFNKTTGQDTMRVYMGPLDHDELNQYDNALDVLIMNNGWYERIFRFFSLIVLNVLQFLHQFISNYGIVIIVFSVLVKIILYPLTKKSYTSMKEMQKIQPVMAEIREKYKNDPQRMNKEMMKLYKEHKVNPLGGCLPMLLQMPLLVALFIVFRSTIQLRGASFIPGWIDDLSRTEGLLQLPLTIPFYGNEFNLLPILMALTMIFQSKMTMQDPKQKVMVYAMPIFLLFIFNNFPSGLNLYYFLFNLLTILQQKFINKGMQEAPPPKQAKQVKNKTKR